MISFVLFLSNTTNLDTYRFSNIESSNIACNADMRIAEIRKFCKLDETSESLMRSAMTQMNLSARAYAQHDVIGC